MFARGIRVSETTKRCSGCHKTKSVIAFKWNNIARGYIDSRCKECRAASQKRRRLVGVCASRAEAAKLNPNEFMELSDSDAGFVAGLIEGEGTIHSSYPKSGIQ